MSISDLPSPKFRNRGADGRTHLVRLITVVPGTPADQVTLPERFAGAFGATSARLGVALRGFSHPAATRAIVLVHPNSPTGHFTKRWEADELAQLCREFDLSLIVDEVFLDYGFGLSDSQRVGTFAAGLAAPNSAGVTRRISFVLAFLIPINVA